MKKRYLIYIICIFIVFLLIYKLEMLVQNTMCGIPGCNDTDTSILYLLLCVIPIFELIKYLKNNTKKINICFLSILIIFVVLFLIEKTNYNDSKTRGEYYTKCSAAYNCKCNDKNKEKCVCNYCQDYNDDEKKCNSSIEEIECKIK